MGSSWRIGRPVFFLRQICTCGVCPLENQIKILSARYLRISWAPDLKIWFTDLRLGVDHLIKFWMNFVKVWNINIENATSLLHPSTGCSSCLNPIVLMNRLNQTESAVFQLCRFTVYSKDPFSDYFHLCSRLNKVVSIVTKMAAKISENQENDQFGRYRQMNTPGNVVRGNQKLCQGNLYGCNRPWLTALDKCKQTGGCSCSCIILTRLQLDFGESGDVVKAFISAPKKKWLHIERQAADF